MCSIEGCDKPAKTKGLCRSHYQAKIKYGDPMKYRVWSAPLEDRFWRYGVKGEREDDCWSWSGARNANGYGRISKGGKNNMDGAHRVSWRLHNGNAEIPPGMFILHSCDNPQCTNPKHLRLGTRSENNLDMYSRGRQGVRKLPIGEDNHKTVLTKDQVLAIRAGGKADTVWAKELGVTKGCVRHARVGITWKHL